MIELGDLQADLPALKNSGAIQVDNVIPLAKGYKSFNSFVELTTTPTTNNPVGLFPHLATSGAINYCGDQTKLYQANASGTFIDKSKAGGYNNSTTAGSKDYWSFVSFGDRVIASNFADNIQKFDTGDSAFSDLVSVKAKYLAVISQFVFAGYTIEGGTTYSQRLKWSGLNNSAQWTSSQSTQSGFQDIRGDFGVIQGVVGGESFGIVFFERAIFRIDYVGTPLIWNISKIADNIGAFSPKSIVSFGDTIYFLAQDGFYSLEKGQKLTPIGVGRVNEFFYSDITSDFENICGSVDPDNSIIVWSYRGVGATTSGVNNKLLIYNFSVRKWSTASGLNIVFLGSASQTAFTTLESLDVLGSIDNLPYSLDSFRFTEDIISLGAFSSDKKFGKFLGGSLPATITTTEFEVEGRRSTLISARPIVDANGETTTVTVTPSQRPSQIVSPIEGQAVSVRDNGDCPLRSTGRYHRLKININGNFKNVLGVDVDQRPEGKR